MDGSTHQSAKSTLELVNGYVHLVKDGGLLVDKHELEKFVNKSVSVFVVDKRLRKICSSSKDSDKRHWLTWDLCYSK